MLTLFWRYFAGTLGCLRWFIRAMLLRPNITPRDSLVYLVRSLRAEQTYTPHYIAFILKIYTLIVQIMMTTNYDDGLIHWSFFQGGGVSAREKKSRKNIQIIVTVL